MLRLRLPRFCGTPFLETAVYVVSLAAVFSVVTQRSSVE